MLKFKLGCYKSYPLQESRPEILGWLAKRNKDGIKLYAHLLLILIILGTLLGAVPRTKVGLVTTGMWDW